MISEEYKKHVQNCDKCWQEDGIVPCAKARAIAKMDEENE